MFGDDSDDDPVPTTTAPKKSKRASKRGGASMFDSDGDDDEEDLLFAAKSATKSSSPAVHHEETGESSKLAHGLKIDVSKLRPSGNPRTVKQIQRSHTERSSDHDRASHASDDAGSLYDRDEVQSVPKATKKKKKSSNPLFDDDSDEDNLHGHDNVSNAPSATGSATSTKKKKPVGGVKIMFDPTKLRPNAGGLTVSQIKRKKMREEGISDSESIASKTSAASKSSKISKASKVTTKTATTIFDDDKDLFNDEDTNTVKTQEPKKKSAKEQVKSMFDDLDDDIDSGGKKK